MYDITKKKIVWFYQFINNMLTEKDYCDYDTCVALWSMGLIPHPYDNTDTDKVMAIISLYEAQKWLREEKGIIVTINISYSYYSSDRPFYDKPIVKGYYYGIWELDNLNDERGQSKYFDSYEEALSEGIKEAVEILKEK